MTHTAEIWCFLPVTRKAERAGNLKTNFEVHSVHSMNVSDDRNCFKLLIELSISEIFCTLTGVGFWLPGLPKFREGLSGPLWTREDHFSFSFLQLNPNPWLGELSKYNLIQDRDLLITFYFLSSWTSRSSPHTTRTLRTYLGVAGHFITGTVPYSSPLKRPNFIHHVSYRHFNTHQLETKPEDWNLNFLS